MAIWYMGVDGSPSKAARSEARTRSSRQRSRVFGEHVRDLRPFSSPISEAGRRTRSAPLSGSVSLEFQFEVYRPGGYPGMDSKVGLRLELGGL